jgi:PAS domain S-box-containing protein
MPNMTGVEFLSRVYERHPLTTRIILTGFADMDAIIQSINAGHVYAYITKPWEPEQLSQVVRRAVDHHVLAVENARLLGDLQTANVFLRAVMDQLDTGALAVDAAGLVQAANRSALRYLGLHEDPRGRELKEVLSSAGLAGLKAAERRISEDEIQFEELELRVAGCPLRIRVAVHPLSDARGEALGRVILVREISHEPLRRRMDEVYAGLEGDANRERFAGASKELRSLLEETRSSRVGSSAMAELEDSISRAITTIENWLAVDDALADEDFPDAQLLRDRMRVATQRWPRPDAVPERVRELERRVEAYYESGENPRQPTL